MTLLVFNNKDNFVVLINKNIILCQGKVKSVTIIQKTKTSNIRGGKGKPIIYKVY